MFSVSTTHYAITLSSPIRRYSQWDQFMDKQNHLYTGVMCLISTGNLTGITENFKRSDVSAITSTENRSTLAIQTYISVINVSSKLFTNVGSNVAEGRYCVIM